MQSPPVDDMSDIYDLVIVGGGPVGSALSLMLARAGLRIAVLEARKPVPVSGDGRTLALSYGSRLILERAGAWPEALQPTPIQTVHVSQRGGFGRAVLRASEMGVPALGYTVSYNSLSNVLSDSLRETSVEYMWDATVVRVEPAVGETLIDAQFAAAPRRLRARLAVLADGGRGVLAQPHAAEAVASMRVKDYAQHALTTLVRSQHPHNGCAYERFTPDGPTALLPVRDRFALVWVAKQAQSERLLGLSDSAFLAELQQQFGDRQGRFLEVGARAAFPLSLRYAREIALPGVVRVGNAAQALHPVAAQGFNIGLRDAWGLSRLLLQSGPHALHGAALARAYVRARRMDRAVGIGLSDFLARVFEIDRPLVRSARGAGLWLLASGAPLRRAFTRAMMFGSSR